MMIPTITITSKKFNLVNDNAITLDNPLHIPHAGDLIMVATDTINEHNAEITEGFIPLEVGQVCHIVSAGVITAIVIKCR